MDLEGSLSGDQVSRSKVTLHIVTEGVQSWEQHLCHTLKERHNTIPTIMADSMRQYSGT